MTRLAYSCAPGICNCSCWGGHFHTASMDFCKVLMWQGAESRRKKKTQGSKNHMLSSAFAALKLSDFLFLPYLWFYLIIYKMQVSNQRQRQTSKSVVFQFEGDRLRATLFWPFFTGAIIQKARISPWRRKTTVERERGMVNLTQSTKPNSVTTCTIILFFWSFFQLFQIPSLSHDIISVHQQQKPTPFATFFAPLNGFQYTWRLKFGI